MASTAVTNHIRVEARSFYVPDRSEPLNSQYFFGYRITIKNEGPVGAKLLRRHWIITDARGEVREVRGDGVVGEQPHLAPGKEFVYTSACPLATQYGMMEGSYQMISDDGVTFDVAIGPFKLYIPAHAN